MMMTMMQIAVINGLGNNNNLRSGVGEICRQNEGEEHRVRGVLESLREAGGIRERQHCVGHKRRKPGSSHQQRVDGVGVRDPRHAQPMRNEADALGEDDGVDDRHVEFLALELLQNVVVVYRQMPTPPL